MPLMAGATLIPGRSGSSLVGEELADFLRERRVTVMACCPTLLATIEQELPLLRILLVGGEACPHNLVVRWYRPGRTILNSYGPTEATVTATLTELTPDKPVTIGVPLPTYSIVILDAEKDADRCAGRTRRNRHCRHRRGARLYQPRRTDRQEIHPRLRRHSGQRLGPHLSHRRPRAHQRRRRDRISRPHRHPGEDPRLSHRIERDRGGAAGAAANRTGRGHDLRAGRRPGRDRGLLRVQAGHVRIAARRDRESVPQPPARLHGAGLSGTARRHSDDALQQGRPEAPAEADIARASRPPARSSKPRTRASGSWSRPSARF